MFTRIYSKTSRSRHAQVYCREGLAPVIKGHEIHLVPAYINAPAKEKWQVALVCGMNLWTGVVKQIE